MAESQNIGWKQSWHDDYLKWICGFANAFGGKIYIGKNDSGDVINVKDARKLLEDIPSKIHNYLGIICDINLLEENSAQYLEIVVPQYSVPVSLRGRYYYRTGSTKVELTGNSLNEFLLKKAGKTWDDVIEDRATIDDIDFETIYRFLKDSKMKERMPNVEGLSEIEILDKLHLAENKALKRSAIILFGKDPNKFYPNICLKIGRFGDSDTDLRFHEVIKGNLIQILFQSLQKLDDKSLVKPISFEGMLRIENDEYPNLALREMILNALVHRTYMGAHIQMRVYDNRISIWNQGGLPQELSIQSLKSIHNSIPRNPKIAEACFMAGYIDTWGRGTIKIIEECKKANLPEPEIKEMDGGISVTLYKNILNQEPLLKTGLNERQLKALDFVKQNGRITNKDYQTINNVSERTALRDLVELAVKNIFIKNGEKKGVYYIFRKGLF